MADWQLGKVIAQYNARNFLFERRWLTQEPSREFMRTKATGIVMQSLAPVVYGTGVECVAIIDARAICRWLRALDGKLPLWTSHFGSRDKVEANARACALGLFAELILEHDYCTESRLIQKILDLRSDLVMYESGLDALINERADAFAASLTA